MNTEDNDRKRNLAIRAYHEAGHAVAADRLGFQIIELDIFAHNGFEGNFRVALPEDIADPTKWRYGPLREMTEKYDVMMAAGYFASEMAVNDTNFLYGTNRSDEKTLAKDAEESFPPPAADPWVLEMTKSVSDGRYAGFVERRWRDLHEAYIAWIKERARSLVRFPAYRHAIEAVALNLIANKSLVPEDAHRIIATALAEFSPSGGRG